jgi:hypothetical protein
MGAYIFNFKIRINSMYGVCECLESAHFPILP